MLVKQGSAYKSRIWVLRSWLGRVESVSGTVCVTKRSEERVNYCRHDSHLGGLSKEMTEKQSLKEQKHTQLSLSHLSGPHADLCSWHLRLHVLLCFVLF